MFDRIFLVKDGPSDDESQKDPEESDDGLAGRLVFTPSLMLLGILYCRSNRLQRAEKFFELLDSDNIRLVQTTDDTARTFVPFLFNIAFELMFRLYVRHRDLTPSASGVELQPEIDASAYLPETKQIE